MSVEVLTQWRTLLTDIGELGGALCGAIEGDDVLGAIGLRVQHPRFASGTTDGLLVIMQATAGRDTNDGHDHILGGTSIPIRSSARVS